MVGLEAASGKELRLVGGKAASLGALMRGGFPVPPGFCISTFAFDHFLASCPGRAELAQRLSHLSAAQLEEISALSRDAQAWLGSVPMPEAIHRAVMGAWQKLGRAEAVAVRSSATLEDSAARSFAGQFESFLNVQGEEGLLEAIRGCWLSLYSERALAYGAKQGLAWDQVKMAVVVQTMVPADCSGVVFTANPLTGARNEVVVEWVAGLGAALVQGTARPERMVVEKITWRVREGGENGAALAEPLRRRLLGHAVRCEALFGAPQDIEWAVCRGEIQLLQARPITCRMAAKSWEDRQIWVNLNTGEVMPDVASPATWSLIQMFLCTLSRSVFRLLGADASRAPAIGLVAGRVYFNATTSLAALRPFWRMLGRLPDVARALGGGQVDDHREASLCVPSEDLPDLGFHWAKFILSWPHILYDLVTHSPRRSDAWTLRLRQQADRNARVAFDSMATPELLRFFAEHLDQAFKDWDLLYLVTQAAILPLFQKACRDWLNDPELAVGYRLFSALGGMPEVEAGLALWRLALLGQADPATRDGLRNAGNWPQVQAHLQQSEAGRTFLSAWHEFMAEHGHHGRGELELFNARWAERPDYILGLVRGYLAATNQCDPVANQRRLAQERRRLTQECRQRLTNPLKRKLFSWSLARAQKLAINREVWKDTAVRELYVLRRLLLVLGQRLQEQGRLSSPEDIFFLELSEVEPVVLGRAAFDWGQRIEQRRQTYASNLKLSPPSVVVGRFDPERNTAVPLPAGPGQWQGIAVSPGVVAGPARVILRADDHAQVLPGEILVAPFTDPAWTPYFVTAAGLVIEQGGILSHGSIIAREYGLPAVTNVAAATRRIRTGDRVQVDGNHGWVSLLECA